MLTEDDTWFLLLMHCKIKQLTGWHLHDIHIFIYVYLISDCTQFRIYRNKKYPQEMFNYTQLLLGKMFAFRPGWIQIAVA